MKSAGAVLVAIFVGAVAISTMTGNNVMQIAEREKAAPTCISDWTKCKNGTELIETYRGKQFAQTGKVSTGIVFSCKGAAKQRAKYGEPQWPSSNAFLASAHTSDDKFLKEGTLILHEPDAKFQNGFGVYGKAFVTCVYDLNKEEVTLIDVNTN